MKRLGEVQAKMHECFAIDVPLERIRYLQLLDEYQSATIAGADTTVDNVLQGKAESPG